MRGASGAAARVSDRESDGRGSARQPRRGPVAAGRHRGAPRPDRRRSAGVVCVDTGSQDDERRPAARRVRRGGHGLRPDGVPRGRAGRARAGRPPSAGRVDLAAPRRLQPRTRRARAAAGRGRGRPRGRRARPEAARVALAASACSSSASRSPAPAGARPGSSAASTTRASTTRSAQVLAVNTAGHAGPPRGATSGSAASTTTCRSSATTSTSAGARPRPASGPWWCPHAVVFHAEAAHRGAAAYAADRPAHPLPGAPRRAVHAAGQRPGPRPCPGRSCGCSSAPCCG